MVAAVVVCRCWWVFVGHCIAAVVGTIPQWWWCWEKFVIIAEDDAVVVVI